MKPISPVLPSNPSITETTYAKDQPQYQPLPAAIIGNITITRWKMTWRERLEILLTGTIWLRQMNFTQPLQPQLPEAYEPERPLSSYYKVPRRSVYCATFMGCVASTFRCHIWIPLFSKPLHPMATQGDNTL